MPRFHIPSPTIVDGRVRIDGDLFHHAIRVRRAGPGEIVEYTTAHGDAYRAAIVEISADSALLEIIDKIDTRFSSVNIVAAVALLKGKKFDLVVQKAVEAGVAGIQPMITERSIPRLEDDGESRLNRWRRIAAEAAQQCQRGTPPPVFAIRDFHEVIAGFAESVRMIAHLDPHARDLKEFLRSRPTSVDDGRAGTVLIGPEGGFSERECAAARDAGWEAVILGGTQMRAETAAIVLPAILIYEWS